MKSFVKVLAVFFVLCFVLVQDSSISGTADTATLAPSSAIILTGAPQPITFSATNDKTFNIKTYHAEFPIPAGLNITAVVTTPAATTAKIDSRKNLLIFEWSAVGQGVTVTGNFNVSANTQGTYTITPSTVYYTDYNRKTYTASCNSATISVRDEFIPPSAPKNIRSSAGEGFIKISWDRPADTDVAGYKIYRRTATTDYANIGYVNYSTYYTDTGVENGKSYHYKVTAVDFSGNESEPSAETADTCINFLIQTYNIPGVTVAAVGDINSDGKPDLVVGTPTYAVGKGGNVKPNAGKVDIYYGGNITGIPDVTLLGENADDQFGYALAVVDMNNDGYDDLIVGAPNYDTYVTWPYAGTAKDAGKVYIYTGGSAFNKTPAYTRDGKVSIGCGGGCYYMFASEQLGSSIAPVGDVNNDGYQDVVISAPLGGMERSGSVLVLFGRANLSSLSGTEITGRNSSDYMGYPVASAGDVNGDGYDDIIAGSGSLYISSFYGKAFLIYGGPNLTLATAFTSGIKSDGFGKLVYSAGDINGDGYADFGVSRYIYYGGPSSDSTVDRTLPDAVDFVSAIGDVNKDGVKDMLTSPGPKIYFGSGFDDNIPDIVREGMKVLAVGDVDRDGIKEIFLGADANKVYVNSLSSYIALDLPDIAVSSPRNNSSTNIRDMIINGSVRGDVVTLTVGGQQTPVMADGTFTATTSLLDGNNSIEIIAETREGKISKRTMNVTYAQPGVLSLTITSPADGAVVNSTPVTVLGIVSDPAARVTVNGIPAIAFGTTFSAVGINLQEGPNVLTVVAQDDYGQAAAQNITVTLNTKAIVKGTVTDSATGLPLSGVAITISNSTATYTSSTDSSGAYAIYGVAQGGYTATFTRAGYSEHTVNIAVSVGQTLVLDAQLTPLPPLTVSITSPLNETVLNSSLITVTGNVSNNAQVMVNGVYAVVNGSAFTASIPLSEGQNAITAVANDTYGQTASQGITVTLVTKGTITGVITDSSTGLPIPSATISMTDALSVTHTALTDANGTYMISNVAQGSYTGTITLSDYSTYSFSGTMTAGQTITINGGIILQAPAIGAISVSNITGYSATITWTTDQPSSSLVEYGISASYGSSTSDPALTTNHSISITNLTPGATCHFKVTSTNSHALSSSSQDETFTTLSPPAISAVTATNMTTNSATITWTTDQPSNSLVEYGTTTAYGSTATDPALTTSHSVTITNLNLQAGYHFRVTSTNNYNLTSSSGDNAFATKSPITVAITSPSNGSTISRPDIMVKGTMINTTGNETGVTVNGIVATVHGSEYIANHVPLQDGTNTITVTATDTAGYTATASVTVTASTMGTYITITANVESGISVLESTLRVDGISGMTATGLDYTGPGQVEFVDCTSYDACKVKMTAEGAYYFTATGTGTDGNTYQDTIAITVLNGTQLDTLLKAKWEGMKTALKVNDQPGAVNYLGAGIQSKFNRIFSLLGANLSDIVGQLPDINLISIRGNIAKYYMKKLENGTEYAYFIYFMKDANGFWKIENF